MTFTLDQIKRPKMTECERLTYRCERMQENWDLSYEAIFSIPIGESRTLIGKDGHTLNIERKAKTGFEYGNFIPWMLANDIPTR